MNGDESWKKKFVWLNVHVKLIWSHDWPVQLPLKSRPHFSFRWWMKLTSLQFRFNISILPSAKINSFVKPVTAEINKVAIWVQEMFWPPNRTVTNILQRRLCFGSTAPTNSTKSWNVTQSPGGLENRIKPLPLVVRTFCFLRTQC